MEWSAWAYATWTSASSTRSQRRRAGFRNAHVEAIKKDDADRRLGVGDFLATLYRHLGVDAERGSIRGPDGRPVPLLQQGGEPIRELTP